MEKKKLISLEDAREDTRRIDWIDQNMDCTLAGPGLHISSVEIGENETLRQALDRTAKEPDNGKEN